MASFDNGLHCERKFGNASVIPRMASQWDNYVTMGGGMYPSMATVSVLVQTGWESLRLGLIRRLDDGSIV